jgi:phosphatidylglycerophosphate synthase
MRSEELVYRVEDRSFLLPFYKRYLVDPLLPLMSERLNPNTITHAGHLLNLAAAVILIALWPARGWPLALAALLLNAYCWADNADGAHARRTNQCSPMGEFLDHGLDQLNTVYIGYLTAYAVGASPIGWVVITLLIPGAAVVTYWEQASTGVMHLGRMNQVESVVVLSGALLASAIFGVDMFRQTRILGVDLGVALVIWCAVTILFGMARSMIRVSNTCGMPALAPILPLVAFDAAVFAAALVGALSTVAAVSIATGATVYFGMRMLTYRLQSQRPRFELQLVAGAIVAAGLVLWRLADQPISPMTGPVLVALACLVYGALAVLLARDNVNRVGRVSAPAAE